MAESIHHLNIGSSVDRSLGAGSVDGSSQSHLWLKLYCSLIFINFSFFSSDELMLNLLELKNLKVDEVGLFSRIVSHLHQSATAEHNHIRPHFFEIVDEAFYTVMKASHAALS